MQAHAEILAQYERGDVAGARDALLQLVGAAIDPEALNDAAVILAESGRREDAETLLRALTVLRPDHASATENLRALRLLELGLADRPGDSERRRRFNDVVLEGRETHLADNVDHFFWPYGEDLTAYDDVARLLAEQLQVLDAADEFWDHAGDEASRALFLRFLAYKALGPAHIRLQIDPDVYRKSVIGLTAQGLAQFAAVSAPGMPFEWGMHLYDLRVAGRGMRIVGPPLPLASTFLFSQYAYQGAEGAAAPRAGDVALDVGGCWGDTALWLADVVGPTGQVHSFEPTPLNRQLLQANLDLNPVQSGRISVWPCAVGPQDGGTIWIPNRLAAGSTVTEAPADTSDHVQVDVTSIDAFVAAQGLERVDFLKVDVEGADPGVLEGALGTIAEHRPRLALACYHRDDDLVVLPDIVARAGVPYRWYLQCSTMTRIDTVLFGVPAEDSTASAPGR